MVLPNSLRHLLPVSHALVFVQGGLLAGKDIALYRE